MRQTASPQPELRTRRLMLRPFRKSDVGRLVVLAGDRDIALNTLNIPHPYERHHGEEWIASHQGQYERRESVTYAITLREGGLLVSLVWSVSDPMSGSEIASQYVAMNSARFPGSAKAIIVPQISGSTKLRRRGGKVVG